MKREAPADERRQLMYVLRLWREHDAAPWRAALRCADDGQLVGFADLEALIAFLQHEMQPAPGLIAQDKAPRP